MYMYTQNFITLTWKTEHRLSGIVSSLILQNMLPTCITPNLSSQLNYNMIIDSC